MGIQKRLKISSLAILGLLVTSCSAGLQPPKGWVKHHRGANWAEEQLCANYTKSEFSVSVVDERVQLEPLPKEKFQTQLALSDGSFLVGTDMGEWGGELLYIEKGAKKPKVLLKENVHKIMEHEGIILVFTGLSHISIDKGRVYKFDPSSKKTELLVDLQSEPIDVILEGPGKLLVLTGKSVQRITLPNLAEVLFEQTIGFAHPQSLAIGPDGDLVIGSGRFLAIWNRKAGHYQEQLYVKKDCVRFELKNYECLCR